MHFRTDISFLRAIAVLMVMFYHFNVSGFNGGFIGVDVFFVISGYLMTAITLKAFDNNSFSLLDFYKKRVKRIVPPMLVMLMFVLLISSVFFFQSDLKLNAKYVALSSFFGSNIYYWLYQNYFSSGDNILLHTWSLGVEWQFYMIYPLILLALKKAYHRSITHFSIVLGVLTILSMGVMFLMFKSHNNFSFYMLPSRYWELSIGGLVWILHEKFKLEIAYKKQLAFAAVLAIIFSLLYITESNIWPSYWTVLPVFATALLLFCKVDNPIFSNKITKFLGDISYSLYLWHWPWFILFKYYGLLSANNVIVLIVLSVISAILSHYFIERNKKTENLKTIALGILMITFISIALFLKPDWVKSLSILNRDEFKIIKFQTEYVEKHKDNQFNPCGCFVTDNDKLDQYNSEKCLTISPIKKNILLIGDSHMAQFSSAFRRSKDINWLEVSIGYTLPIATKNGVVPRYQFVQDILKKIVYSNNSEVDMVVVSAHWLMSANPQINLSETEVLKGLALLIEEFKKNNINYLIVGQTEAYDLSYPKIQMLKQFGQTEKEYINLKSLEWNKKLMKLIGQKHYINIYNSHFIDKFDEINNEVYMYDSNHFSNFGAQQAVDKIILPKITENF